MGRRTNRKRLFFLLSFLLLTVPLIRKRKSRLRTLFGDEGKFIYQTALTGRTMSLPADHYSHPNFKTEWWYYTGNLESESGKRYGYQVTFFRFGLRDRQKEIKDPPLFSELYMTHFALS